MAKESATSTPRPALSKRDRLAGTVPGRDRRRQIYHLALPIIGGMISQNVLNLVDTAMVGSLGDSALAATGVGAFANFMALSVILGLSAGVQAMAARRLGEGRESETAVPLNGGLLLALGLGIPFAAILILLAPHFFALLNDDPEVLAQGVPYLQLRLAAMAGVGMNFAFRGYWSAIKHSQLYLRTLVTMHAVNIVLNWILIFGNLGAPALGVSGAALATTLSVFLGTGIYIGLALRHARHAGFLQRLPRGETLATMVRISLPASAQQLFFTSGMVALLWLIGRIGTAQVAATNVLLHIGLVGLLPAVGMGLACASLVGHALGRGEAEDARRWGWNVSFLAMLLGVALGLPAIALAQPILAVFIHDPETLALARWPLAISAGILWLDAAGMVLLHAHLGAGDTKRVMLISIPTQWALFLPTAYWVGVVLGFGLLGVWLVQAGYRLLQAGLFAWSWQRGRWAEVRV